MGRRRGHTPIDIPLVGGIDRDAHKHLADPPSAVVQLDMHFDDRKALTRRGPWVSENLSAIDQNPVLFAELEGQQVALQEFDGVSFHDGGGWRHPMTGLPVTRTEKIFHLDSHVGLLGVDTAQVGDVTVVAWVDAGDPDDGSSETGIIRIGQFRAGNRGFSYQPRVVTTDGYAVRVANLDTNSIVVFWLDGQSDLRAAVYGTVSDALSPTTTLKTGIKYYDAVSFPGSTLVGVVVSPSAAPDVEVFRVDDSGAGGSPAQVDTTGTLAGRPGDRGVSISQGSTNNYLVSRATNNTGNADVNGFTVSSILAVGTDQAIFVGATDGFDTGGAGDRVWMTGVEETSKDWMFWACSPKFSHSGLGHRILAQALTSSAVPTGAEIVIPCSSLAGTGVLFSGGPAVPCLIRDGPAFNGDGTPALGALISTGPQIAMVMITTDKDGTRVPVRGSRLGRDQVIFNWREADPEAEERLLPRLHYRLTDDSWILSGVTRDSQWSWNIPGGGAGSEHSAGIWRVREAYPGTLVQTVRPVAAAFDGSLVFSGGVPSAWDGGRHTELVLDPPRAYVVADQLPEDTQDYAFVWAYTDSTGQTHRSAPTLQLSVGVDSLPANMFLHWFAPLTSRTLDEGTLQLEVYGCAKNAGGTGAPLHLIAVLNPWSGDAVVSGDEQKVLFSTLNAKLHYNPGDFSAGIVPIQLYTQLGELANEDSGPSLYLTSHQGRLWSIDGDNPQVIRPSKLQGPNGRGFAPLLDIPIPEASGKPVALASHGDVLLVLTDRELLYIAGPGPNNAGVGSFAPPQRIPGMSVGCSNSSSVVSGPFGTIFQGQRTLWKVEFDLSLEPIGLPVQDYLNAGAVHSSCVVPGRGWACFGQDDRVLIYDFVRGVWYAHSDYTPTFPGGDFADFDMVWSWAEELHYLDEADLDTAFELTDGNANDVYSVYESPWIKLSSIQGFYRAKELLLLGVLNNGDLIVDILYNYDDTVVDSYTFSEFDGDIPFTDPMQLRIHIPRQKEEAIKVRVRQEILDQNKLPTSSTGLTLTGVTLLVQTKEGSFPILGDTEKF